MRHRIAIANYAARFVTLFMAASLLSPPAASADPTEQEQTGLEQSRRVLARYGLSPQRATWILKSERELRKDIARLDTLERHYYSANDKFQATTRAYRMHRNRQQKADEAREALSAQLARPGITPLAQQQIDSQMKRIEEQLQPSRRALGDDLNLDSSTSILTRSILDYLEAQNALGLALLDIRRQLPALHEQYENLAQNTSLQEAFDKLSPKNRLGPLEDYTGRYLPRIERLQRSAFGKYVPIYRAAGQFRIPAILNETAPVTFSHTGSKGRLLLTASALQAAGIEIPLSADNEEFSHEKRNYSLRRVVIPRLRFGENVLEAVTAWALPPEGEHIGCRLSAESLPGHSATLDEEQLRFRAGG